MVAGSMIALGRIWLPGGKRSSSGDGFRLALVHLQQNLNRVLRDSCGHLPLRNCDQPVFRTELCPNRPIIPAAVNSCDNENRSAG